MAGLGTGGDLPWGSRATPTSDLSFQVGPRTTQGMTSSSWGSPRFPRHRRHTPALPQTTARWQVGLRGREKDFATGTGPGRTAALPQLVLEVPEGK